MRAPKSLFRMSLLASSLVFAGLAQAGEGFYGGIEYAGADAGGDSLPFAAQEQPYGSGDYTPILSKYGSGDRFGAHLGYGFSNRIFVELGYSRASTDEDVSYGEDPNPTTTCDISPTQGTRQDCYNQAVAGLDYTDESIQLIVGRHFQPWARTTLSPYIGARRIRFEDDRHIDYNYRSVGAPLPGFQVELDDRSEFSDIGWVAGFRWEQDWDLMFLAFEASMAQASGNRDRSTYELRTQGGSFLSDSTVNVSDDITVSQEDFSLGLGRHFAVGGGTMTVVLGYRQRAMKGLDTRNTNTDYFAFGELGDSKGKVVTRGPFLSLSFGQGSP